MKRWHRPWHRGGAINQCITVMLVIHVIEHRNLEHDLTVWVLAALPNSFGTWQGSLIFLNPTGSTLLGVGSTSPRFSLVFTKPRLRSFSGSFWSSWSWIWSQTLVCSPIYAYTLIHPNVLLRETTLKCLYSDSVKLQDTKSTHINQLQFSTMNNPKRKLIKQSHLQ